MTHRSIYLLLGATAALATTLTACGGGGGDSAGNAPGAPGAVAVQTVNGVGQTLADGAGKTLYFADQEAGGTIKCTNDCLDFWFPVEAGASTAKSMPGLATVRRSDTGKDQLTYQGKPLYTFRLDTGPAQHQGNNLEDSFGGMTFSWHAATTAASPSQPPSSSSDKGYGY